MKQMIIVALVCLNAALLVALAFGAGTPAAEAQVMGGGTNYIVMTGYTGEGKDALYILDLGKRRLTALRFERKDNKMRFVASTDLRRDFGRKRNED